MYQWQTMQETIDDLAGKISVKKRDNESVFRQMQDITKRNEGLPNFFFPEIVKLLGSPNFGLTGILPKNIKFWSKIEILVKNRNFGQESKF